MRPGFKTFNLLAILLCIILHSTVPSILQAADDDDDRFIVYKAEDTGKFEFYPVTYYMNAAFDTSQVPAAFTQENYYKNHRIVFNRIKNPFNSITQDGGFKKFFRDEFASERVMPNVTLHMIGGGYDFRKLAEWYEYNNTLFPYACAFITTYAARLGNEAIESTNSFVTSHDHIADLYIFDLVGNLMFMNDDVANFFHHTLQMRNWSGQPMFNLSQSKIVNAGSNYVFRPFLFGHSIRPFAYIGMHYMGGLSFKVNETDSVSISFGIAVTKPFDPVYGLDTPYREKIRASAGVFFDRDDRLLFSLIINGTESYKIRFNVYPETFQLEHFDLGFFSAIDDNDKFVFGVTATKHISVWYQHQKYLRSIDPLYSDTRAVSNDSYF
ncbi:MAG: hypothetical protein GY754_23280 [bacterium]|nr:hypothetical protein [bacterium]